MQEEIVKITHRDIADAGELAHIYNDQFVGVPHCYTVSPDEFVEGLLYRKDADKPYENLYSEKIIVGKQDGRIVGFADVAVVGNIKEEGQKERQGLIRLLTYQRGYRPVGQALLEESEHYLSGLGVDEIKAFRISYHNDYCYRFYHLGFGLISDRTSHICALFRMNGYEVVGGEIFMDRPNYRIDKPVPPDDRIEIVMEQHHGRADLPGLIVKAMRDAVEIGTCESVSVGKYCQAREAQDWIFIKWLGVEEEEQAKGWGRYLLQRNLWEARQLSYRNTVISCNIRNYRAQLFYTNYGYRVVDTTYGFGNSVKG
jgi:GNAT superfamily N-acetyltransferase